MILTDKRIIERLKMNSHYRLDIRCDYCYTHFKREFRKQINISDFKKDACNKCNKLKNSEVFLTDIHSNQIEDLLNILKYQENIVGIYSIRNKQSNKSYIGSSKNVLSRWKTHINEIRSKKHYCTEFNQVDVNDLEFIFLKECENGELLKEEYKYIQLFETFNQSGYNTMGRMRGKRNVKKL